MSSAKWRPFRLGLNVLSKKPTFQMELQVEVDLENIL